MYKSLLISFLFICVYAQALAQVEVVRTLSPDKAHYDSLMKYFGKNKTLLKGLELQILLALSYYPELVDEEISFRYDNMYSIGKTRPTVFSLLRQEEKRFVISLNKDRRRTGFLLSEVPFNAQVGLIGHELAHIIQMKNKNLIGMLIWGIRYATANGKRSIERETDHITMLHGLGWQLYDWMDYILTKSNPSPSYRKFKEKYYLQPDEILTFCKNNY